jgi:hypothetical protein
LERQDGIPPYILVANSQSYERVCLITCSRRTSLSQSKASSHARGLEGNSWGDNSGKSGHVRVDRQFCAAPRALYWFLACLPYQPNFCQHRTNDNSWLYPPRRDTILSLHHHTTFCPIPSPPTASPYIRPTILLRPLTIS